MADNSISSNSKVAEGNANDYMMVSTPDCLFPLSMPNFPIPVARGPIGGRLREFAGNWAVITSDQWVLHTVRHGHQWQFLQWPVLMSGDMWRKAPCASQNLQPIRDKVYELLSNGTIERVHDPASPCFYSRFFVVPKKTPGAWRAILDLKALNVHIVNPKFKMETAESIRRDLVNALWTTSIDLVDAYMHLAIHPHFRHFLRFVVDGVVYQYVALPAGLCTVPWAFTRLIAPVKVFLHRMGISLHQYIDDWLIRALTFLLCSFHTRFTVRLIHFLGFYHHDDKSVDPTPGLRFSGLPVSVTTGESVSNVGTVPENSAYCGEVFTQPKLTGTSVAAPIGLASCHRTVGPSGVAAHASHSVAFASRMEPAQSTSVSAGIHSGLRQDGNSVVDGSSSRFVWRAAPPPGTSFSIDDRCFPAWLGGSSSGPHADGVRCLDRARIVPSHQSVGSFRPCR